jgi:hypothetical protein
VDLKISASEEEALIAEVMSKASGTVHHGLARRMAARSGDAQSTVAIISDDGVYLAARDEAARLLLRVDSLRPLAASLDGPPPPGHLWALCLRGATAALRPLRLDRSRLTIRRPASLVQEQFLDALLWATAPTIRHALATHAESGAPEEDIAIFLHDSGPGVIATRKLQDLLRGHGFFHEADQLDVRPRPGHVWVWLSSWQEGGTTGLRQLTVAAPAQALSA